MTQMKLSASLVLAAGFVAACAGSAPTSMPDCGCTDYMPPTPRPSWVDRADNVTAAFVETQGAVQCTGLQEVDYEGADLSARGKLSRIINIKTDFALSETRTDEGYGAGRARARIDSSQISRVVLEGSRITARWVDPDTCRVHTQVRLSRSDMEQTKARLATEEAARLVNQRFIVQAEGPHAAVLIGGAKQALSEAGVSRIVDRAEAAHRVNVRLDNVTEEGYGLIGQLSLAVISPAGETVWSRTVPAKAASYSRKSKEFLVSRAVQSALRNLRPALKDRLMK